MGYTNYWKQPTPFTDAEWSSVCKEFNIMKDIAGDRIKLQDVNPLKDGLIVFDGGKDGSCETFVLHKLPKIKPDYEGQDLSFNFCKTRELPYDIYVWHMLTFCSMLKHNFVATRDEWSYDADVLGIGDGVDEPKEAVNG